MIKHFKKWNEWRKHCLNSPLHKLLVLLGIVKSPTFVHFPTKEDRESFMLGFLEGLNEDHKEGQGNT